MSEKEKRQPYDRHPREIFIYLPAIPGVYPLFDFNNLKDQYLVSHEWARTHKPIPLAKFLKDGISIYE